MAGTWLPKGTRERLSAHRGVTVAKSQTHALYTIRVLLMKSAPRSQVAAARQRSDMSSLLCPSRGADTFYCSFVLHLDFPLGTSAIPEVVAGFLPSLPFSPWTPIPLHPSFPLFLKTLLVCLTHAAEAEPLSRFSIRTRCSEGKLRGCAVTLLVIRHQHVLHCLLNHRGTKAVWCSAEYTAAGALHLW